MTAHRNFGLDLARALAIIMVFLSHGVTAMGPFGIGVNLFFVLSGFLIGRIYLRSQASGERSPWKFWQARWFRTLPPYIVALGLFALCDSYFHSTPVRLYYLVFLQNYLGIDGFGPSWSLCVEEHFYLALPILGFFVLHTLGRRSLSWVLPLLAIIPTVLRVIEFATGTLPPQWYWRTELNAEGLIFGVWLAYIFLDHPKLWKKFHTAAIPLSVIPIVIVAYAYRHPDPPVFYMETISLFYAIGFSGWLRLLYDLRWTPANALSRLTKVTIHGIALASYSIYLVHTLFFTDIRIVIDSWPRGVVKTSVILVITMALSVAFYFAVERPTIQLRDRYLKHS